MTNDGRLRRSLTAPALVLTAVSVAAWLGGAACLDVDRLTAGPPAAEQDGAAQDGASSDVAAPDGSPFGVELLDNGDFEAAGAACAPWQATSRLDHQPQLGAGPPYSGSSACRACADRLVYTKEIAEVPVFRAFYRARAWVRGSSDGGNASVSLVIRTYDDRNVVTDVLGSPYSTLTDTWRLVEVTLDVFRHARRFELSFDYSSPLGQACIVVDGVSFVRTQ